MAWSRKVLCDLCCHLNFIIFCFLSRTPPYSCKGGCSSLCKTATSMQVYNLTQHTKHMQQHICRADSLVSETAALHSALLPPAQPLAHIPAAQPQLQPFQARPTVRWGHATRRCSYLLLGSKQNPAPRFPLHPPLLVVACAGAGQGSHSQAAACPEAHALPLLALL